MNDKYVLCESYLADLNCEILNENVIVDKLKDLWAKVPSGFNHKLRIETDKLAKLEEDKMFVFLNDNKKSKLHARGTIAISRFSNGSFSDKKDLSDKINNAIEQQKEKIMKMNRKATGGKIVAITVLLGIIAATIALAKRRAKAKAKLKETTNK